MKYAHIYAVLCFVVVLSSTFSGLIHVALFTQTLYSFFTGTVIILHLPPRQWSKPEKYGKLTVYQPRKNTITFVVGEDCHTDRISFIWITFIVKVVCHKSEEFTKSYDSSPQNCLLDHLEDTYLQRSSLTQSHEYASLSFMGLCCCNR